MVQEELTGHDVEGQVVQGPADEEEAAERVVLHDLGCGTLSDILKPTQQHVLTVVEVTVAALGTEDEESADSRVCEDSSSAEVPDHWVTEQIDLAVILDPKVLFSASRQ